MVKLEHLTYMYLSRHSYSSFYFHECTCTVTVIVRELCCVIDVRQTYHKFKLVWAQWSPMQVCQWNGTQGQYMLYWYNNQGILILIKLVGPVGIIF